jgi:hypothetical protein
MCKVFGVMSLLAGIVVLTLDNPVAMANMLWVCMAAVAALSIFTVATTRVTDYTSGTWNPKQVECCKREIPGTQTARDYTLSV